MITKKVKIKNVIDRSVALQNLKNAAQNLLNAIDSATNQLNKKYNNRVRFNLELMGERAVDAFYESYSPNMYSRQEGLYKAVKVIANDDEWSIDSGAEYMETDYKVGKDYVYVNSFEKGWHGGAIDGPDHPEPGIPWWKAYGEWYRRATRGPSPDQLLEEQNPQEYIDEQEEQWDKEWNKIVTPYYKQFMVALSQFFGGDINGRS